MKTWLLHRVRERLDGTRVCKSDIGRFHIRRRQELSRNRTSFWLNSIHSFQTRAKAPLFRVSKGRRGLVDRQLGTALERQGQGSKGVGWIAYVGEIVLLSSSFITRPPMSVAPRFHHLISQGSSLPRPTVDEHEINRTAEINCPESMPGVGRSAGADDAPTDIRSFGHTHVMPSPLDDLLERAVRIEREIEHELNHAREHWRYRIDAGRVRFEQDVRAAHQRLKQSIPAYLRESNPLFPLNGRSM